MKERQFPAVPLIVHDPNFSIWQTGDTPAADDCVHWCGSRKMIRGMLNIDGTLRRFLGRGKQAMKFVDCQVTPLSTRYVLEDLGIRLTVTFTSPLLLDDLELLSTPISFMEMDVEFTDGKPHTVGVAVNFMPDLCHSGEIEPQMRQDFFTDGTLNYAYMGNMRQKPLSTNGDRIGGDWGYLFLATEDTLTNAPEAVDVMLHYEKTATEPFHASLLIGYDEVASINYFGRLLPAYFARDGKTITQALAEFHKRREEILGKCHDFDQTLLADARHRGGEDYAQLLTAAYRQTVGGHKLVEGPKGELLFISKENDSNGCAATVDISYPSVPLFLLYNPELVRGMLRPVLKFAKMPIWSYDFAPHDVGRYPILNGQIYAAHLRTKGQAHGVTHAPLYLYPAMENAYRPEKQMPVEESANMLLMLAAVGYADGDWSLALENLDMLSKWCQYLIDYGEDPGNQLCTDDFAGHLARNVNLAAKAFLGVAAYGMILEADGRTEEARKYMATAQKMADSWLERAWLDGYTALTFNGDGWSVKYNLVWDKLFGWNLLPDHFYRSETQSYLGRMNEYGLPLDSRGTGGKTDWMLWAASMAEYEALPQFVAPVAKFLRETPNRVPFSDYYDTTTAIYERMMARTVQGGLFMPLLMEAWQRRR